jgi:hypothetical protein
MGLEYITLCQQSGIFIELRKIKMEKLDDSRHELYNFESNVVY